MVACLDGARFARVGDGVAAAFDREDDDVAVAQAGGADRLAGEAGIGRDEDLGHAVAVRDAEALADVQVGELDHLLDVLDDRAGDVLARRAFDPFQPRGGVHLHDLRAVGAFEHVDAGDAQAHDLRGADGGAGVDGVERDRLGAAAAVDVGAELLPLGDAAHGGDDAVADDEGADVASLALGDKLLDEHVLAGGLERLDDRLGDLLGVGEDDADALRAFQQLDDDRRAADAGDRGQDVAAVADEAGGGDADVVA